MNPQLVRDHISRDLIDAFEQMFTMAKNGEIVGVVFGIALRGRKYHVNVAGTLARDPTFARGIVAALDDELMQMVQGNADTNTTL